MHTKVRMPALQSGMLWWSSERCWVSVKLESLLCWICVTNAMHVCTLTCLRSWCKVLGWVCFYDMRLTLTSPLCNFGRRNMRMAPIQTKDRLAVKSGYDHVYSPFQNLSLTETPTKPQQFACCCMPVANWPRDAEWRRRIQIAAKICILYGAHVNFTYFLSCVRVVSMVWISP